MNISIISIKYQAVSMYVSIKVKYKVLSIIPYIYYPYMYINIHVKHINTDCLHMVLVLSYGQCSQMVPQMVYIQFLTSIHADGVVIADEFLICRLDGYSI